MNFDLGAEIVEVVPRLRRFALSLTRSVDEADDLVQAACERALAGAAGFEVGTRVDSWLFRIVRNLWYDRLRRRRTRGNEIDVDSLYDLADPKNAATGETRLLLADVWAAIGELPTEQREVLLLVCVEELSYRATAEILDVPIGTVMSRLARARRKVAEAADGGIGSDVGRSSPSRGANR